MCLRCSQEHLFWCSKAQSYYPPRTSAIHGCNPKLCARPRSWHRIVLTNPVRCCSASCAAPSCILPPYPQVWIRAAQPSGLSRKRRTTARPLVRAKLLLRSTAYIIQTSVPSAVPRVGMLRNLYRLLAPLSAHTIYRHHTRARVINYWRQGADVLTVSLPTTPSERTRKNGPLQPEHAIWPRSYLCKANCVFWENVPNGP
jgi:hypothetical protein